VRNRGQERIVVSDLLFVALAVAFFALLLAYVAGCARLLRGGER
jgi:hypothetical protein